MRLYVVTSAGAIELEEHAGRWEVRPLLLKPHTQCIAIDSRDPRTVFVGTRGLGLLVTRDGGRHWRTTNMPAKDVFSVAVSDADGAVYAGCEPSAIYKSEDSGLSWRELESLRALPSAAQWSFPPRPWTSHVRWIAPHPSKAGRLLAGIELGGVMYSDDGGETWQDHRPGAQRDVHGLAWHPVDERRAYEAAGGGPAWSRDGGRTWQTLHRGLDRKYTWALAVLPHAPDTWFISASPSPRQAHSDEAEAAIYRWRGNGPWHTAMEGLPQPLQSMPYVLLSVEGLLLAGLRSGRLFESSDEGDTWRRLELDRRPMKGLKAAVTYTA